MPTKQAAVSKVLVVNTTKSPVPAVVPADKYWAITVEILGNPDRPSESVEFESNRPGVIEMVAAGSSYLAGKLTLDGGWPNSPADPHQVQSTGPGTVLDGALYQLSFENHSLPPTPIVFPLTRMTPPDATPRYHFTVGLTSTAGSGGQHAVSLAGRWLD